MATTILPCSCSNEFQDKEYGKGQRVYNFASKQGSSKTGAWRCSVCGKIKEVKVKSE